MLAGLTERQEQLYADFYNSTRDNQYLSQREALLVGLATAMAVNCIPCQRFYLLECRKAGVSKGDVCEVLAKVMAVSAGQKRLQFQEVLDRFEIDLSLFSGPAGP
jgi:alkylhydroperoxidase/carboxymuconolactone decarboxylase family protein YurZ